MSQCRRGCYAGKEGTSLRRPIAANATLDVIALLALETAPPHAPCPHFRADRCGIEASEWMLVDAFVTPRHAVLELGARFGTTSCYLARATNNSGSIVAVEPDRGVWPRLTRNLATNGCNVSVVLGSVSDAPLLLDNRTQSYGTRTRVAATDSERARAVENLSFDYVQRAIGRPLNALLIDCEGCIGSLLTPQDAPRILERTELILLEHDQPQAVVGGYQSYFDLFRAHGLHQVWLAQDTFKPSEAWSRLLKHSAWVRPRNTRELDVLRHSCRDYARRRNYTRKMLHCLDASQDDPVGAIRAEAHGGLIDKQVEAEIKRHVHCGRRIPLWQCDAWRKLEMHD